MSTIGWLEISGWLLAAWATGYGMGLVVLHLRKFADKI